MISCTEFIPAYSELFRYLEKKQSKAAVIEFWNWLSDNFLTNLSDLVVENGIRGCWLYWEKTLNEEAADFTMELDEEAGEFSITMHRDYCEHCDVLYRRVLEPLGFEYDLDRSHTDQARCRLRVKSKKENK